MVLVLFVLSLFLYAEEVTEFNGSDRKSPNPVGLMFFVIGETEESKLAAHVPLAKATGGH